jgi:hypothetical protein
MLQIIGTNEVTHKVSRFNPGTGRSELITTVLTVGRVIAEHQTKETTAKHCAKLKRCHPAVRFIVKTR